MSRPPSTAKVLPFSPPPGVPGVVLGRIVGVASPLLLVEVPGHGVQRARVAVVLSAAQAEEAAASQAEAALVFADGDPAQPVVVGVVQAGFAAETTPAVAHVDGARVVIEGKEEIVLRCGEATITLSASGKLVIRGAYVETRASGTNRIKGGSVQIN